MRRIRILSAPAAIAIDEEPLGVEAGDLRPVSGEGFEFVPPWQARPARGRRRALASVPALAGAAAVALSISGRHDATPIPADGVQPTAPARSALVVEASPTPTDVSRAPRSLARRP